ncbi:MAG: hypothetical protein Q7T11_00470, partial [Deltaproteobacteria bacterium]|nr:hypothetical protein [Deltaproteobacteria bacterium]
AGEDALIRAVERVFQGEERENSTLSQVAGLGLFTFHEGRSLLLRGAGKDFSELQKTLILAQAILKQEIERVKIYIQKLQADAASFSHFANVENGWGITSVQSEDGSPYSALELDGAVSFHDYLLRAQLGASLFSHGVIEEGELPLEDPHVQTFLHSPAARIIDFGKYYDNQSDPEKSSHDPVMVHYYRGLIEEARDAGAVKYAWALAESVLEQYEGYSRYLLYDPLPGGPRHVTEGFKDFANHYVNLPSVGILAGSGLVGQGLAATPRGVAFMEGIYEGLGRARYLLPGVALFAQRAGQSAIRSVAVGVGNLAAEIGKMAGLNGLAHPWEPISDPDEFIAVENGSQNLANLALFVGGVNAGYASALEGRLIREGTAAKTSPWFQKLFERNLLARIDLEDRINRAAATGRRVSLRLSRAVDPHPLQRQLGVQQRTVNRATRQEQKLGDQIGSYRQRLNDLEAKHGGKLDDIGREADDLAKQAEEGTVSLEEAARRMKELSAKGEKRHAQIRREEAARKTEKAGEAPIPRQKGARREKQDSPKPQKKQMGEPKSTSSQPDTRKSFEGLRKYQKKTPKTIADSNLEKATEGRVTLDPSIKEQLEELYRNLLPGERRSFWRRILELAETASAGRLTLPGRWKMLQTVDRFSNRIGRRFRIIVEREGDTFRIVTADHRRQVYGDLSDN